MVPVRRLTRRHAVALGAVAGAGTLVARPVTPVWALRAGARPRAFAMRIGRSDLVSTGRSPVITAPGRFDLVGADGPGLAAARLELRARAAGGRWTAWLPISAGAHRPDGRRHGGPSDPVWIGDADELQLRAARPLRGPLTLRFVVVPAAARRPLARAAGVVKAAQAGAPAIIPRAAWGAAAARPRDSPSYGSVQLGFVHHTVTANTYGPADSAAIVLGIAKYHISGNGWDDIGYNFLVDRYGQIFEGRAGGIEAAVIGAQAAGWNSVSTGVAILGTHSTEVATPEATDAVGRLLAWKLPLHGAPLTGTVTLPSPGGSLNRWPAGRQVTFERISGHRDGCSTSCPGDALYGQLQSIRERALAVAGPAGVQPPAAGDVSVTLDPPPPSVLYGQQLAVTGAVRLPDGSGAPGRQVRVQKRGRSRWVTIGSAVSGAAGEFTISSAWRGSGAVRARVDTGIAVAVSAQAKVDCLPKLTAKLTNRRVKAGRRAEITGLVRPRSEVTVVIEKQGSDKAFHRVRAVKVAPKGTRYRFAAALNRPGLYRLTVRAGSGDSLVKAPPLMVRVVRRR